MLRALNQRSNTEPIWVRSGERNVWLMLSVAASAALMGCVLFVPGMRGAFELGTLSTGQWLAVAVLAGMSIVQMEVSKLIKRRAGRC